MAIILAGNVMVQTFIYNARLTFFQLLILYWAHSHYQTDYEMHLLTIIICI